MTTGTGYRIAEVAHRTGFTSATLRYYESIGLMPPADRTRSGYRVYDDRSLRRLEFIARAKQLGCTLDEITDLAQAWDGDECAPVQHRLKGFVNEKLALTRVQIAELTAFADELETTKATLSGRPVDGACDDSCGCMAPSSAGDADARSVDVILTGKPEHGADPPLVCTLNARDMPDRMTQWESLLAKAKVREPVDGGVCFEFGSAVPVDEIASLAAAEQDCCRFFSFTITIDGSGVGLAITAPPDAVGILEEVFGLPA